MPTSSALLNQLNEEIRDGENNLIDVDIAYRLKDNQLQQVLDEIFNLHGDDVCLMPLSATSAGGGVFLNASNTNQPTVGLQISNCVEPNVTLQTNLPLESLALDDIVIDKHARQISAGAGITLQQLNHALGSELGMDHRVLGADLTSYAYAQVGSTFMTGGMGPQRRYFSDSVVEICLHNGHCSTSISGDSLNEYAGTYGWSGIVSAVKCRYYRLPANEIAFAMPVSNTTDGLATMLEKLGKYCYLNLEDEVIRNKNGLPHILLGLEHLTTASMQPLINSNSNPVQIKQALRIVDKCEQANADGVIFVSGFSELQADQFLTELIEQNENDAMTIGGVDIEFAEMFSNPEDMREFRESVPFAARTIEPKGKFIYKSHTDGNIRLNADAIYQSMSALWKCNCAFVNSVQQCLDSSSQVDGSILVYGHMNPYGVDPHNRVTFSCDDEDIFNKTKSDIEAQRARFYRNLQQVCIDTGSVFIGGEKGADSEQKILSAFESIEQAPSLLRKKFNQQKQGIQSAGRVLNWRAFTLYR